MYNGIGLETARGSGTNGYVQRNLSFVRLAKPKVDYKTEDEIRRFESEYNKPPNQEILEHHRKRKIEVECLELEEKLEKEGLSDEEIQKRVDDLRKELIKKMEKALENRSNFILEILNDMGAKETHQLAQINQERNNQFKSALGISESFVEGTSMDLIRQAKEQQAEREQKIRENKDLIVSSLNAESKDSKKQQQPQARSESKDAKTETKNSKNKSKKKNMSSDSSDSSSSDSSSDSDSSSSEDDDSSSSDDDSSSDDSNSDSSSSSSSDSSANESSNSDSGSESDHHHRYQSPINKSKQTSKHRSSPHKDRRPLASRSRYSSRNERGGNESHKSKSRNSNERTNGGGSSRRDLSPPRKYARYSSGERNRSGTRSISPKRRQLSNVASKIHKVTSVSSSAKPSSSTSHRNRHRNAHQRSRSPHDEPRNHGSKNESNIASRSRSSSRNRSESKSRSRSPIYEQKRSRGDSRSVDLVPKSNIDNRTNSRSSNFRRRSREDSSRSRSRSVSPRLSRPKMRPRKRSTSRDRFGRSKAGRKSSPSLSRSRTPPSRDRRNPSPSHSRSRTPPSRDRRSPSRSHSRSRSPPSRVRRGRSSSRSVSPQHSKSKVKRSSKSRSRSIPRRRGSPSFLEKRRITSARKLPVPYKRTDSSSSPATPWSLRSDGNTNGNDNFAVI